ncbi:hypothetical protein [Amycolatopsis aidingensis]|uniref:hypothetical protein n=1 Tax=Amycolatopsis aidingensis TaxID=2842453 RepID=UPI001E3CBA4F|nr:hypothetical protein [Amycolatopsis aidingensis]
MYLSPWAGASYCSEVMPGGATEAGCPPMMYGCACPRGVSAASAVTEVATVVRVAATAPNSKVVLFTWILPVSLGLFVYYELCAVDW